MRFVVAGRAEFRWGEFLVDRGIERIVVALDAAIVERPEFVA